VCVQAVASPRGGVASGVYCCDSVCGGGQPAGSTAVTLCMSRMLPLLRGGAASGVYCCVSVCVQTGAPPRVCVMYCTVPASIFYIYACASASVTLCGHACACVRCTVAI
jgi:hypothetical protein